MRYPLDNFTISNGYNTGHQALDLAVSSGTVIKTPESGTIIGINNDPNDYYGGLWIKIKGDSGYTYYMGHNSKNSVSIGQRVTEGQEIGNVGMTGFKIPSQGISAPTGPHIHFQVWNPQGQLVDPSKLISKGEEMDEWDTKNSYLNGLHREPSDNEWKGRLGKRYSQVAQEERKGEEWLTQNHVLKVAYPESQVQIGQLKQQINDLKAVSVNTDEANLIGRALIKLIASFGYKKG